jgi:hypothetical protein
MNIFSNPFGESLLKASLITGILIVIFRTLKPLITHPGFLSKEFIEGKRIRYVPPIRLYFFISVVFFLLFYLLDYENIAHLKSEINAPRDKTLKDTVGGVMNADANLNIDSTKERNGLADLQFEFKIGRNLPSTIQEYEAWLDTLPANKKPGIIRQYFERKDIEFNKANSKEIFSAFIESLIHNLPKLMFFLLPVFALLLKLVYVRRRNYFFEHAVFTLYLHSFIFLFFTIVLLVGSMFKLQVSFGIVFWPILFYLLIAMRKVYQQSWLKTLLKLVLITGAYIISGSLVFLIYGLVLLLVNIK